MLPLLSSPQLNSNQLNRNSTKLCCGFSLLAFVGIGLLPFRLLRSQQTLTHTRTGNLGFRRFSESSFCSLSLSRSRRIHLTVARARARALDSSGPTWLTALSTAAAAALRRQQKQKQQPGRRRRRNSSSASNPIARLVLRRRRRFRSSRRFSVSGSLLVTHSRSIWLPARSSRSQLA